ncbi:MAG: ABC transporter substrate binding protein [Sideroxydans sp.]|nr:ABC transporter substrate binding protein [Sideroxydans sp.]
MVKTKRQAGQYLDIRQLQGAQHPRYNCAIPVFPSAPMTLRRIPLLKLLYGLLCVISCFTSTAHAESLRLLLLLSNNNPSYQAFSAALQQQLPDAVLRITSVAELANAPQLLENNDVIVALGLPATEQAARQASLPMLSVFVPQVAYRHLVEQLNQPLRANQMGVIYLNQPLARQVDFIATLLPSQHKVGVLYAAGAHSELAALHDELKTHGSSLIALAVQSEDGLFTALEKLLNQSDVLLALPDNNLYSSSNVRNILLSTYRLGVPVIGFSASYVNAGALAAIFASPEQTAQQAATFIHQAQLSGHWNSAQFADSFSIAINSQIARSLALSLPSEAEIRQRMNKSARSNHD